MAHRRGSVALITQFACLVVLAGALSACGKTTNPAGPGSRNAVVASGHPEWPPIMFQSGAAIDGAGPALVRKIFDDLETTS